MATATYTPIATQTLSSNASIVTFSSIPQTYTDLILVTQIKDGNNYTLLRVGNGSVDSGSNYSRTYLLGNGSTANSSRSSGTSWYCSATTSYYDQNIHNIMNYSNTTTYKTSLERATSTGDTYTGVNLWRSTSAINIISVISATGGSTLGAGSTFTLYGIKAA